MCPCVAVLPTGPGTSVPTKWYAATRVLVRLTLKLHQLGFLLILSGSHFGITLSHGPLVPFLALLLSMRYLIEMCNDYTNNTWISPYCKNSNTADKMKAFLASSASRHATVLPCSD